LQIPNYYSKPLIADILFDSVIEFVPAHVHFGNNVVRRAKVLSLMERVSCSSVAIVMRYFSFVLESFDYLIYLASELRILAIIPLVFRNHVHYRLQHSLLVVAVPVGIVFKRFREAAATSSLRGLPRERIMSLVVELQCGFIAVRQVVE